MLPSIPATTIKIRTRNYSGFKRDRAFRSVKHGHDTLAIWDPLPIGFLSVQEGFDATAALGWLLLNLLASLAEFELEMIRERMTAGMERAKKEGKAIGGDRRER